MAWRHFRRVHSGGPRQVEWADIEDDEGFLTILFGSSDSYLETGETAEKEEERLPV